MSKQITVKGVSVSLVSYNEQDYISLTDMISHKDGSFFISDWLRNRNTLEYIGIWEKIHNTNFNYGEFATIKSKSGLNNFKISVKHLIEKANVISIISKPGRYGGTYAHKDLAFEFGMWISPEFKIYLIKEYQKLKEQESEEIGWSAKRELAKINYLIHTDAIKSNLIVPELTKDQINYIYASEADMLNVVIFGQTASQWKQKNQNLKGNIRDYANIDQLLILANLESYNAILIEQGLSQSERILMHHKATLQQAKVLNAAVTNKKKIT